VTSHQNFTDSGDSIAPNLNSDTDFASDSDEILSETKNYEVIYSDSMLILVTLSNLNAMNKKFGSKCSVCNSVIYYEPSSQCGITYNLLLKCENSPKKCQVERYQNYRISPL
jgi:hypothetical protein